MLPHHHLQDINNLFPSVLCNLREVKTMTPPAGFECMPPHHPLQDMNNQFPSVPCNLREVAPIRMQPVGGIICLTSRRLRIYAAASSSSRYEQSIPISFVKPAGGCSYPHATRGRDHCLITSRGLNNTFTDRSQKGCCRHTRTSHMQPAGGFSKKSLVQPVLIMVKLHRGKKT
jgi:hypothetical protein